MFIKIKKTIKKYLKNTTSNTEITQNTNATKNVAREDVAKENNLCTPQDILDRAPATQNNHIEVSAVL